MQRTDDQKFVIGFLLAVIGTLLFSLKSIFIKYLYQEGLNADSVLVLRMVLSLPVYAGILIWTLRRHTGRSAQNRPALDRLTISKIILLGFFGYYLASLLDLMGLELISAQLERLSLFSYPFMVAVLGYFFFREPLTLRLAFSLIVTYAGLWIVMSKEIELSGEQVIDGTLMVLASALSFALYVLFSKGFIKQLGSQLFTCIAMLASCFFGLIHGAFVLDVSAVTISQASWLWLLLLVIFSTVIPSFMTMEAINCIGPAKTGIVGMLGPVFTIVLAISLLNEPFTQELLIGSILMMCGVLSLFENKSAKSVKQ